MTQRYTLLTELTPQPNTIDPLSLVLLFSGSIRMNQTIVGTQVVLVGSGGTGPYTYAISVGALPTGLTLNTATGAITGTTTATGEFFFTATLTDSTLPTHQTLSKTCKLLVRPRLTIVNGTPTPGEIGVAYSYTFSVANATGSVTWTQPSGTLPAGLTLSSAGVLSGTPTGTAGTAVFTAHAVDAGTGDTLDIACAVQIFPILITNGVVANSVLCGVAFDNMGLTVSPSGGAPPYHFAWGNLSSYPWLSVRTNQATGYPIFFGVPPIANIGVQQTVTGTATDGVGATAAVAFSFIPQYAQPAITLPTTKGDIVVNNGTGNVRVPVGADTYVWTADSTQPTGTKWAPPATGGTSGAYLQASNNLSDVASAATARTNLGLGSAATYSLGTWLQVGNNLSDLANAATARTNLGLGTAATKNTGTSGATVPLLNAANTWSASQTFTAHIPLGGTLSSWQTASSTVAVIQCGGASDVFYNGGRQLCSNLYYDGTNWRYIANGAGSVVVIDNTNGLRLFTAVSGTVGAVAPLVVMFGSSLTGALSLPGTTSQYVRGDGSLATFSVQNLANVTISTTAAPSTGVAGSLYFQI